MAKTANTQVAVKDLAKWLRENLYLTQDETDDKPRKFSRFVIRQIVKGNKRGEDVSYTDVPKKANEDWADRTAQIEYTKLNTEAAILDGLQKWAFYAYFGNDFDTHVSRHLVSIQGRDESDGEFDLEPPDKTGITTQLMRHVESQMKINVGLSTASYQSLLSQVQRQQSLIDKLMDQRASWLEREQELIERKGEQEIALMREGAKAETIRDVGKRLALFIPAIANKVAGANIFPVEASAVTMMTKGLLTSIMSDPDRAAKFMQSLRPEEQIAAMNLYEAVSKVDDKGRTVDNKDGDKANGNGVSDPFDG